MNYIFEPRDLQPLAGTTRGWIAERRFAWCPKEKVKPVHLKSFIVCEVTAFEVWSPDTLGLTWPNRECKAKGSFSLRRLSIRVSKTIRPSSRRAGKSCHYYNISYHHCHVRNTKWSPFTNRRVPSFFIINYLDYLKNAESHHTPTARASTLNAIACVFLLTKPSMIHAFIPDDPRFLHTTTHNTDARCAMRLMLWTPPSEEENIRKYLPGRFPFQFTVLCGATLKREKFFNRKSPQCVKISIWLLRKKYPASPSSSP